MDSKHLATGESCPALVSGSLRIYSMRFCPYAQRALLAAAAKGISYDVVNINLLKKPEFIFPKNPEGKVPTIETNDGKILYESLIVADYIDEAFNDVSARKLNPVDPFQKALDRIWIEKFDKINSLDFQLYFNANLTSDQVIALIKQLNEQLMIFEKELQRRGTDFFGGMDKPGMLDYMIWPWMERLPSLELIYKDQAPLFLEGQKARPLLGKWQQAMIDDNGVKASYLSPEIHTEYREMRRSGVTLNYDFLHSK